jgi:regulator of sigma E protease
MEILITILSIIACVLLFSLAVFIHEFGHFIAARKLGLRVEAFSIGFGPAIWKKKINGVEYRISIIPFGGYVSLPDLDPEGTKALEGETKETDEQIADELPAWKKIIVAFAGPFGNIVLAVVIAVILAVAPGANFGEIPAVIGEVPKEGPAFKGGMKALDKVVSVNGNAVSSWSEMQTEVQLTGGKKTPFVLERDGKEMTLFITPERDKVSGAYYILALSTTNNVKASAWMPSRNPLDQLAWDSGQIFRVLKALVTPKEAKAAASALGGPVMIAEGLYNQVRRNGWDALGFLRFLCINLAILNLLPIPVLDGGLIMFALYEILTGKKVPRKLINGLSQVFMYLFLGLMLLLVYRDIARSRRIHAAQDKMQQEMSEKAVKEKAPATTVEKAVESK